MEAALRLSGSFPRRHLGTASQETPSSTPPGRPARTPSCTKPSCSSSSSPLSPSTCDGSRFPPRSLWINNVYCPVISLFFSYRRALSNNCTEGAPLRFSPRRQRCPSRAPRGLQLLTSEGTLVATLGRNVTFLVFLEEVLTSVPRASAWLHAFLISPSRILWTCLIFFFFWVIKVLRVVEQQVCFWGRACLPA